MYFDILSISFRRNFARHMRRRKDGGDFIGGAGG